MTTISFLNQLSIEEISSAATATVLDEADHDIDTSLDVLSTLQESQESLTDVILTAESLQDPTDRELTLLYQSANLAIRPIGLRISTESIAMEAGEDGFFARVKETLRRIWEAIKRAIARVWDFMKKHFGKMYLQHRQLQKDIDNLRIVLDKNKRNLPQKAVLETTEDLAMLGFVQGSQNKSPGAKAQALIIPSSYNTLKSHLDKFLVARKAICEDYSKLLVDAIDSLMAATNPGGKFGIFDKAALLKNDAAVDDTLNKLLAPSSISSALKGLPVSQLAGNAGIKQDLMGGYELHVTSNGSSDHGNYSVQLIRNNMSTFEASEVATYSNAQIADLLKVAETLKNEIMRGSMEKHADYVERSVAKYKKGVDSYQATLDSTSTDGIDKSTVQLAASVFRKQADVCSKFTSWGSAVFLKMETVSLRTAIAIARMCRLQLSNYG